MLPQIRNAPKFISGTFSFLYNTCKKILTSTSAEVCPEKVEEIFYPASDSFNEEMETLSVFYKQLFLQSAATMSKEFYDSDSDT